MLNIIDARCNHEVYMIIHFRDALIGVGRETITAYHENHSKPTTYIMGRKCSSEIFKELVLTMGTVDEAPVKRCKVVDLHHPRILT